MPTIRGKGSPPIAPQSSRSLQSSRSGRTELRASRSRSKSEPELGLSKISPRGFLQQKQHYGSQFGARKNGAPTDKRSDERSLLDSFFHDYDFYDEEILPPIPPQKGQKLEAKPLSKPREERIALLTQQKEKLEKEYRQLEAESHYALRVIEGRYGSVKSSEESKLQSETTQLQKEIEGNKEFAETQMNKQQEARAKFFLGILVFGILTTIAVGASIASFGLGGFLIGGLVGGLAAGTLGGWLGVSVVGTTALFSGLCLSTVLFFRAQGSIKKYSLLLASYLQKERELSLSDSSDSKALPVREQKKAQLRLENQKNVDLSQKKAYYDTLLAEKLEQLEPVVQELTHLKNQKALEEILSWLQETYVYLKDGREVSGDFTEKLSLIMKETKNLDSASYGSLVGSIEETLQNITTTLKG